MDTNHRPAFAVRVAAVPNPDFTNYRGSVRGRASWVPCASLAQASAICRAFIDQHDLGSGNWVAGEIRDQRTKKVFARVSYNGRVWDLKDKEIPLSLEEIDRVLHAGEKCVIRDHAFVPGHVKDLCIVCDSTAAVHERADKALQAANDQQEEP